MSLEYDIYLKNHIRYVGEGLRWMIDNLPMSDLGFDESDISNALDAALKHDDSKWTPEEYYSYDAYFYGGNRSFSVVMDFNYAWLHHQHKNPHHWQHWVLINDDPQKRTPVIEKKIIEEVPKDTKGLTALPMPKCFILEMIADLWTFSWRDGNLYEIFDWWDNHPNIILHRNTRELVMNVLHAIYQKLEGSYDLLHGELTDEEIEKRKYAIPEERKFPMPDKAHVRSAIRFFNYVEPKYEKQLADAILERMKEYSMSFDDFGVGDENRFKKYIPKKESEEEK